MPNEGAERFTRMKKLGLLLAAAILMASTPLLGHHGTGISYDNTKSFMRKATVTEFRYANPHPQIFFDMKNDKGEVEHWSGEIAANPSQLVASGWGRKRSMEALAPGTEVTVTIAPSRAGGTVGLVQKIVNGKGEEILRMIGLGNPGPAQPQQ